MLLPHPLGPSRQENLPERYTLNVSTLLVPPMPDIDAYLQSMQARKVAATAFLGYGYLPYPDSFREAEFIHEVAQRVPVVLIGKEHSLLKLDCIIRIVASCIMTPEAALTLTRRQRDTTATESVQALGVAGR